ncbi:putative HNH endonuclease [Microbacterium sp. C448]|uniref:HNH endonuclease signature motif containing protein n=1 Tax=Microbacterium sp. C448 TaxID=1177594 RepID=UPI0003DE2BB0|nr:HNH endonuclease signature motif containing protein [Microbacterium sp. C448]CDJ99005.1 putative HNH endonuclease [Microbacterium sp. C448]
MIEVLEHPQTSSTSVSMEESLGFLFDDLQGDQFASIRHDARRAAGIAEAIEIARRHPYVYTDIVGRDGEDLAERGVLLDLSLRLNVSEQTLRSHAYTASAASESLPWLWRRALDGFAPLVLVDAVVAGAARLRAADGASPEEIAEAESAIAELDAATSEWVLSCTRAAFRARLKRLLERLDTRRSEVRHAAAMRDRRVCIEHVDDGMSWVSALVPTVDAVALGRRLDATAKATSKDIRELRTRDQIRADLFASWLKGDGTATAVKTKVFVTVPVSLLAGEGTTAGAGGDLAARLAGLPREDAELVGHGPIDPLTAAQLFSDAKAFHRVITDPVRGVVLQMDRRTYRPTKAQRDWLVLRYGRCARDGCTRLALDADIDHDKPWALGGKTDEVNLRPLCPPDHQHRHITKFRFITRSDGTVRVETPTGYVSSAPPPF